MRDLSDVGVCVCACVCVTRYVREDADLQYAIEGLADGGFYNAGQVWVSSHMRCSMAWDHLCLSVACV